MGLGMGKSVNQHNTLHEGLIADWLLENKGDRNISITFNSATEVSAEDYDAMQTQGAFG